MLTCVDKFCFTNNNVISEYCRKSTMDSIKKKIDYYNLERNKPKFINKNTDENNTGGPVLVLALPDDIPKINLYAFFGFLSISTIGYFFYKRIK